MVVSVQPDYLTFLTKKSKIYTTLKSCFCIFFSCLCCRSSQNEGANWWRYWRKYWTWLKFKGKAWMFRISYARDTVGPASFLLSGDAVQNPEIFNQARRRAQNILLRFSYLSFFIKLIQCSYMLWLLKTIISCCLANKRANSLVN